jgi:hypothetical protein
MVVWLVGDVHASVTSSQQDISLDRIVIGQHTCSDGASGWAASSLAGVWLDATGLLESGDVFLFLFSGHFGAWVIDSVWNVTVAVGSMRIARKMSWVPISTISTMWTEASSIPIHTMCAWIPAGAKLSWMSSIAWMASIPCTVWMSTVVSLTSLPVSSILLSHRVKFSISVSFKCIHFLLDSLIGFLDN